MKKIKKPNPLGVIEPNLGNNRQGNLKNNKSTFEKPIMKTKIKLKFANVIKKIRDYFKIYIDIIILLSSK